MDKVLHCWADEAEQYKVGSDDWAKAFAHGGWHLFAPRWTRGPSRVHAGRRDCDSLCR
jgi:hypothetical protein